MAPSPYNKAWRAGYWEIFETRCTIIGLSLESCDFLEAEELPAWDEGPIISTLTHPGHGRLRQGLGINPADILSEGKEKDAG